ncbi:copper chaperone PCu(A)C [Sneathiella marina]|uniref:Copper chaperone PCu(A)C n=1 Tax=Sneathiella marina TaxID=2950108 RepID=A0ABY4W4H2_9PROT|nr:copper chaperone PCu(A)C [Sneathiella marina]USG60782.1 copper chaperone PCu(A)C [Sneathiella marina]
MKFLNFLPMLLAAFLLTTGIGNNASEVLAAEKHNIMVKDAWSRARPGSAKVGGAFVMIKNEGSKADRLVSVKSPVAKRAEIHESFMKEGVMSMAPVDDVVIEPGQKVMLKPGGLHIMLMGLTQKLKMGEEFPMTLVFEHAGDIKVMVHVKEAGAMSGAHKH